MAMNASNSSRVPLRERAAALQLSGLIAHWDELLDTQSDWLEALITWEENERNDRGLRRRLRNARIGHFKPMADFDWDWPTACDRAAITELMILGFLHDKSNVVLVGGNGVGKTMIAQNLAHQCVLRGRSALFANAAAMLGELAAQDSDNALRRKLRHYTRPDLLVIDEVGYLSYGTRHADLLFEIINRRYETKSTVVTTNRPFAEWNEVFPNAACVVSIIDRLVHHAEIIQIEGQSYRHKEAQERTEQRRAERKRKAMPNRGHKS